MKRICTSLLILAGVLFLAAAALAEDTKAANPPQAPEAKEAAPAQAAEVKTPPAPAQPGEAAKAPEPPAAAAPQTQGQPAGTAKAYTGKVVDAVTKNPIEGAPVTLGDQMVRTDKDGAFSIAGAGDKLRLRAVGYERRDVPFTEVSTPNAELPLKPLKVKALYLSATGPPAPRSGRPPWKSWSATT